MYPMMLLIKCFWEAIFFRSEDGIEMVIRDEHEKKNVAVSLKHCFTQVLMENITESKIQCLDKENCKLVINKAIKSNLEKQKKIDQF